jgi:hypothetical protein
MYHMHTMYKVPLKKKTIVLILNTYMGHMYYIITLTIVDGTPRKYLRLECVDCLLFSLSLSLSLSLTFQTSQEKAGKKQQQQQISDLPSLFFFSSILLV